MISDAHSNSITKKPSSNLLQTILCLERMVKTREENPLENGSFVYLRPNVKSLVVSWFQALARNLFYNKFEISSHWFDCLEEKNIEDQSKTPISSA